MLETIREFAFARLAELGRETRDAPPARRTTSATSPRASRPSSRGRCRDARCSSSPSSTTTCALRSAWAADRRERDAAPARGRALAVLVHPRHLTEGRAWLVRALADHTQPEERRAPALRGASAIAAIAGDLKPPAAFAEELVEARRSLGDDEDIALALVVLANVTAALGEQEPPPSCTSEAATHARRAGARPALAGIMSNLGYLALLRDDPAAARATCREAAALFEELGFGEEAAGAWLNAAAAELLLGDLDEARRSFARSLDRYVDLQHAEGVAYCLDTAAAIAAHGGDAHRAAVLAGAAGGGARSHRRLAAAARAAAPRRHRRRP